MNISFVSVFRERQEKDIFGQGLHPNSYPLKKQDGKEEKLSKIVP
jgi:hypothetical protein